MSHYDAHLAAKDAQIADLKGQLAVSRADCGHLKAIVRHDRDVQLPEERLMLIATTNRWSTDFQGAVE